MLSTARTTRERLAAYTAGMERAFGALGWLSQAAADPTLSDSDVENIAVRYIRSAEQFPRRRQSPTYQKVLHAMRHRPEVADELAAYAAEQADPFEPYPSLLTSGKRN